MQNQVGMPWKQWIIQSIPKPTAEQELSHQQFWLRILALYRGHTTMALFFCQEPLYLLFLSLSVTTSL